MNSKDIEIAIMSHLSNWKEIDNVKGYYQYVVDEKAAYEIIVTSKRFGESNMQAIANAYMVIEFALPKRKPMFTREPIALGRTVEECLEKVVKDYKENMK